MAASVKASKKIKQVGDSRKGWTVAFIVQVDESDVYDLTGQFSDPAEAYGMMREDAVETALERLVEAHDAGSMVAAMVTGTLGRSAAMEIFKGNGVPVKIGKDSTKLDSRAENCSKKTTAVKQDALAQTCDTCDSKGYVELGPKEKYVCWEERCKFAMAAGGVGGMRIPDPERASSDEDFFLLDGGSD